VQVILFAKFTWADRATAWFRDELIKYASKDPYGGYQVYGGYQYQTMSQFLDMNTKRLVPMCFLAEEYLQVCEQEFTKLVRLGAAGMLFDECQHHGPAYGCFDPAHGHRPGANVYANDRELIRRLDHIAKARGNAEFFHAGEACYDWEMEAYHLLYFRSWNKSHVPAERYLLPHALIMTAVNGFDDRNMVNQCLLYRYIMSYEPYNFKGSLDDFPRTVEYGGKMEALRTELREYFWDGTFRDTLGATVTTVDGNTHHPYTVYTRRRWRRRAGHRQL